MTSYRLMAIIFSEVVKYGCLAYSSVVIHILWQALGIGFGAIKSVKMM